MPAKTLNDHIVVTPGVRSGKPCIAGHRITVGDVVVWHEQLGIPAAQIAKTYDLTMAEVYAALAYYFDHREAIDQSIADAKVFAERMKRESPDVLHRDPDQGQ